MRFGCIDIVGSARPADAVYFDTNTGRLWHEQYASIDEKRFVDLVVEGIVSQRPDVLAIDAPSKRNVGQLAGNAVRTTYELETTGRNAKKFSDFRVCEMLLKRAGIGLYNTPRAESALNEWVRRGLALYERLMTRDYELWETAGDNIGPSRKPKPTLMEVHPHACFVVGLGWVPQHKQTLAGQLERCAWIAAELKALDIKDDPSRLVPTEERRLELGEKISAATWNTIAAEGLELPEFSHDLLDALAGLITVAKFTNGVACAVGNQEEGVVVLPKSLATTPYRALINRANS